ncbi:MAG: carbamoyl-phosphate synthase small subunit [Thermoplasmata archaeon HGW-Thermoplasmata-2]|nr:MAG: carbamoyl-phosphate synthase small subunit [Thermoplasmata archaeon HGW-Thermoplasmata-2]
MDALLVLEDGTIVRGNAFGASKTVFGELVFNTGMQGYQESLTDPSYNGQILMPTYPLIGNYGINSEDMESQKIWARGFAVSEWCPEPIHRKSEMTIDEFLKRNSVPGIAGIDTRALTIKTRVFGTMRAALSTDGADPEKLLEKVKKMDYPDTENLVAQVSCKKVIEHPKVAGRKTVALIDCGVKGSIVRHLSSRFNVVQVPYDAPPEKIREFKPGGLFISNGPGNPAHPEILATTVATVRELSQELPTMGICLGHQILSLAFGAKTYKLKFGHRGANQPVKDLHTGRCYITSQNHGFAVDAKTLPEEIEVSQVNVNDGTVEGMRHKTLPIFSVQYHPEASPGPHDTEWLFDEFERLVNSGEWPVNSDQNVLNTNHSPLTTDKRRGCE